MSGCVTPLYGQYTVHPLRACQLCEHSAPGGLTAQQQPELMCTNPRVTGPHTSKPAEAARAMHGGCGPNATHMMWLAGHVQAETAR